MSLMKFLPNCLDKMRIEEGKALRVQLRHSREKSRAKVQATKDRANKKVDKVEARLAKLQAKKNQQSLFARAKKVK